MERTEQKYIMKRVTNDLNDLDDKFILIAYTMSNVEIFVDAID
jgi:hypothetical protein